MKRRAADILAYFDHTGTSNGPTEATAESNTFGHRAGIPKSTQLHHQSSTGYERVQNPTNLVFTMGQQFYNQALRDHPAGGTTVPNSLRHHHWPVSRRSAGVA